MTAWTNEEEAEAANCMAEAIRAAGFELSGPTDSRAAEKGEPPWVCVARGLIAKWSVEAPAPGPCPRLVSRIAARVRDEGHPEELYERVSDVFASRASDLNNQGPAAAVGFLLKEGFSEDDIFRDAFVECEGARP